MPRKKAQPQIYPVKFPALQAAMDKLKTKDPTHLDPKHPHQKYVDTVTPGILDGYADAQIIEMLLEEDAGSREAMTVLVATVRHIVESTWNGKGGEAAKVRNMELPCQSSAVAGPEQQIASGTGRRRQTPKSSSPLAGLPPLKTPAGEANSEASISDMTNLAAEAALDVMAAAPPMETAPSMSPSSPTADGGGTGPIDGAVAAPKSTSQTQTTPGATDRAIDAAAAPSAKAALSATPSPPTGDRYKAAASDAAAPKSAPKPGHDQTRLEFPPTDRLEPQSEKS